MTYRVVVEGQARKALSKIPEPFHARIERFILSLEDDPRPTGTVALKGWRGRYRFRIGDYRVIFDVRDAASIVVVVDLGHRGKVYRDF